MPPPLPESRCYSSMHQRVMGRYLNTFCSLPKSGSGSGTPQQVKGRHQLTPQVMRPQQVKGRQSHGLCSRTINWATIHGEFRSMSWSVSMPKQQYNRMTISVQKKKKGFSGSVFLYVNFASAFINYEEVVAVSKALLLKPSLSLVALNESRFSHKSFISFLCHFHQRLQTPRP